ncbi:hypothetical protein Cgig2_016678 [Carnegiea gigantea]|uniref:Uncharacterized protein n=1 Tax=Carnegiea gigantea TaxID=171969 RepID=A0A9Q1QRQ5_9CARY|nr:hypothetical protein Cgig2_016678 [Carnegiea gigantea]
MEQNVQVMARKVWHIVRVAFFMLRKNIAKRKLLLDLKYLTLKRSKLAGKLTHMHHSHGGAYEFSCNTTTPNHHFPFHFPPISNKKRAHQHDVERDPYAPTNYEDCESEIDAVNRVLEMMTAGNAENYDVEASPYPHPCLYSPVLPGFGFGFGRSPVVRVTDSPYPVQDWEVGSHQVDEAAEEFIKSGSL